MNPNQPDPNNPNPPGVPQPDLSATPPQSDINSAAPTSAQPPSGVPMPDVNPAPIGINTATPMQTPSAVPSFDPAAPVTPADAQNSPAPNPLTDVPDGSSAPTASSFSSNFSTPAPIESAQTLPPSSAPADPTPTFTPPSGTPEPSPTPQPVTSTDPNSGFSWPNNTNPPQTFGTETPQSASAPLSGLTDSNTNPLSTQAPSEPAPSDLSHLVNPTQDPIPQPAYTPLTSQPDTLVSSTANGSTEVPNLPAEGNHSGIKKWLIIAAGVLLLLIVAGASAYFILGFGKPAPAGSTPAVTTEQPPIQAPPAVRTQPIPTIATPPATGSAGFGTIPGTGTTQATSAADLLRQRQGQ